MSREIGFDAILDQNSQVDPVVLKEAQEALRQLREMGVQRKEYDIPSPFGGRRVMMPDSPHNDPRVVRLRRSSSTN